MAAAGALPSPRPRIVNGVESVQFPTTGALLSPGNPDTASMICSGTLIGCETFLTAAHCVCESDGAACQGGGAPDPADFLVFLQHAGFFAVSSISLRTDYDFPIADVAVLKLATQVAGVAPTAINTTSAPASGTAGTIAGFGRSGDPNFDYGLKRTGSVTTATCTDGVSNTTSVCWNFVAPLGPPGTDSNTCNGDSGGPLFVDFGAGLRVAGVTSGGTTDSCLPDDMSYDANVFHYRTWIQSEGGADLANTSCGVMPQVGDAETSVVGVFGTVDASDPEGRASFMVPTGTSLLRVAMNAIDDGSDFDLYVKAGAPPTTALYDCRRIGSNQYAFCEFAAPAAGSWHVLVQRWTGSGSFQVTATTFGTVCAAPGSNGLPCDDANACTANDVCQAGACAGSAVANGTVCDDGSLCTPGDSCQGGTCVGGAAPVVGCSAPTEPEKASLLLRDKATDRADKLTWKWLRGAATMKSAFGTPTTTSGYALCVYDRVTGVPRRILEKALPAGSRWTETSDGFKYRDRDATTGIGSARLKAGAEGKASIVVKGRGQALGVGPLPLALDPTVSVQLLRLDGTACWSADYSTAIKNQVDLFKAKSN